MSPVRFGDGINEILDCMLQVKDQFVVAREPIQRIAVAKEVKDLKVDFTRFMSVAYQPIPAPQLPMSIVNNGPL